MGPAHGLFSEKSSDLPDLPDLPVILPRSTHQHALSRRSRPALRLRVLGSAPMQANAYSSPASGSIVVAIVEDDHATREALARLIDRTIGYRCVGTFPAVEPLLAASFSRRVDVFLLDINLPGMSGCDGARLVHEKFPTAQIVMLTVYADEQRIFDAICNGACGYLLKETPPAKLLEAISDAHAGGAPMSREVARKVVTLFQKQHAPRRMAATLTPQEIRVVELLAQGYSYQGAAQRMNVSVNTVRNYIRAVYDKLHVHTKSEAVSKAMRDGLV